MFGESFGYGQTGKQMAARSPSGKNNAAGTGKGGFSNHRLVPVGPE
jgi:hypothetical protein